MPANTPPIVAYQSAAWAGTSSARMLALDNSMHDEMTMLSDEDALTGLASPEASGSESLTHPFGTAYSLLERQRPDVASLARFAHRVEVATFHMCIAFEQAGVHDFEVRIEADRKRPRRAQRVTWLAVLADTTFDRFKTLRQALRHDWIPSADVEPLTYSAFHSLCELTPAAGHHLKRLFHRRRSEAIEALVGQLDLTAKMLEDTMELVSSIEHTLSDQSAEDDAARLASAQAEILARAGEPLGLRQAAERLLMSHQNLHKRIKGRSALGLMRGRELIVPSAQFVQTDEGLKIVPDLKRVLRLFEEARAGEWAALQFLVELDPRLRDAPIEVLKRGNVAEVVASARAYLGIDEA